jgi:hypothetical protein
MHFTLSYHQKIKRQEQSGLLKEDTISHHQNVKSPAEERNCNANSCHVDCPVGTIHIHALRDSVLLAWERFQPCECSYMTDMWKLAHLQRDMIQCRGTPTSNFWIVEGICMDFQHRIIESSVYWQHCESKNVLHHSLENGLASLNYQKLIMV